MTIEEFHQEFMNELAERAGSDETFTRSTFVDHMCAMLEAEGFITGYSQTDYSDKPRGIAVDAWSFDPEHSALSLVIADFRDSYILDNLTRTDIEKAFKRLLRFVQSALGTDLSDLVRKSSPEGELAWLIRGHQEEISRISLILVTNAQLSSKVAALPEDQAGEFPTTYEIWDLGRIHRSDTSGKTREDIVIDFSAQDGGGLPCLPAYVGKHSIQSYLLVLPGPILADLYDKYGDRLLEQNVRTFLQFRGNINKGMRNTIMNEPHMFFSFNNGLAATAEKVTTTESGTRITSLHNLQIVNGGQTTASIFTARRKEGADLANVYVQVKLSVVPGEEVEEIVPKISQYSNTQNKVNAADFFSNHPFHLRVEEISRRLWAPAREGSVQETHWFYERTRGQYANQQAKLTQAQKNQFLRENPRSQMFTKTDLAKFVLSFEEYPHEVSLGAQKAFAGSPRTPGFVGLVATRWERDDGKSFNQVWFKQAISMAIFFRSVDRLVYQQEWYGGYKANIVTYTLAKFAAMVREAGLHVDHLKIWNLQHIPDPLADALVTIAKAANQNLIEPPADAPSNVTEWAKKEACWDTLKSISLDIPHTVRNYLIDHENSTEQEKDGSRTQVIQDSIHAQTYVFEKGAAHWEALREWNRIHKKLSPKEMGILNTACAIPRKIPSDKQAPILIAAEKRAIAEGFYVG